MQWQWQRQSPAYANFGNANQWTVNAGMASLAREATQNSNDASLRDGPADLVFTFIRLTGERRRAFEEAVGWHTQLEPHVDAMRGAAGGAVSAGQLGAGLDALRQASSLVLLRISDYGCRGLTGDEFADGDESTFGNFVKLCRLDLYSGKSAASGGSFGLGKAVYWRFSRMQTVLFNSTVRPEDAVDGQTHNRLFGVQQGVAHRYNGGSYDGRGHFGLATNQDDPVRSSWGDTELVDALHLRREDARPGTSALVVGFYDPDDPQSGLSAHENLTTSFVRDLRASIEENFWPALTRGRIRVRVDVEDDGKLVHSEQLTAEDTFTELVHALRSFDVGELSESLDEPGSVVVRDVPISIPKRRPPRGAPVLRPPGEARRHALRRQRRLAREPRLPVPSARDDRGDRRPHPRGTQVPRLPPRRRVDQPGRTPPRRISTPTTSSGSPNRPPTTVGSRAPAASRRARRTSPHGTSPRGRRTSRRSTATSGRRSTTCSGQPSPRRTPRRRRSSSTCASSAPSPAQAVAGGAWPHASRP
ncbi:hypothetical protein [Georgenia sp. SUBG003]|uniref:hypothetical protein n=1 Tax=Georgenia sp. SUBG003 TaxID=1497974 RepID=UPI003AB89650